MGQFRRQELMKIPFLAWLRDCRIGFVFPMSKSMDTRGPFFNHLNATSDCIFGKCTVNLKPSQQQITRDRRSRSAILGGERTNVNTHLRTEEKRGRRFLSTLGSAPGQRSRPSIGSLDYVGGDTDSISDAVIDTAWDYVYDWSDIVLQPWERNGVYC